MEGKHPAINPIFIFAGGTRSSYKNFARDEAFDGNEEQIKFVLSKGPDFVSRLRGHIDILGPNKSNEYDIGYVTRRAILLRDILVQQLNLKDNCIDICKGDIKHHVSLPIVRAMLMASKFKHGARSMQAIIDMCITIGKPNEAKIRLSSLPTHAQLNMHVDANEFMANINSLSNDSD